MIALGQVKKNSSLSSPPASFFPAAWIFLFFYVLYFEPFKEFPLSIIRPFCSFRHSLVAVRKFSSTLAWLFCTSRLLFAPYCYFGAILLFWRHIVILAPYCYFGAILLFWRHIVILTNLFA
jgi:hypothetical protein